MPGSDSEKIYLIEYSEKPTSAQMWAFYAQYKRAGSRIMLALFWCSNLIFKINRCSQRSLAKEGRLPVGNLQDPDAGRERIDDCLC